MAASITLDDLKNVSDVFSNVATALALVVGGAWAYWRFLRERTRWPRAALALELSERHLDRRNVLLAAKLHINNEGRGLMKLTELRFDLYRVRPLDEEMRSKIDAGNPYSGKRIDADWPAIDQRIRRWSKDLPELEPGESDEFCCDFFLRSPEETVFLYAYVENVKKKRGRRELGWSVTAFHDFEPMSGQSRWASLFRR